MKELVSLMTFAEVTNYIERHPDYRLPAFYEAMSIVCNYPEFWVSDVLNDRQAVFNRGRLEESHVLFKKNVILIRKGDGE